jgi:hypothetical protein
MMEFIDKLVGFFTTRPISASLVFFVIGFFYFLRLRGGIYFPITTDGQKILMLCRDLENMYGFKRAYHSWDTHSSVCGSSIIMHGNYNNCKVHITLANMPKFKTASDAMRADIRDHFKGMSVTVRSDEVQLDISKDSIEFEDIEDILKKVTAN